ncbi:NAD(P)/FAD-dependent oxidoreductase [Lacipirellula parvula]|uniref:NADH dehydrogenase n=1 Tax=Lacipirellula parvula TaxID=2650471 RepID=A0A5K7X3U1_9BACT|nr:NAD(P)/FAD-dependent oxidoreductase [Lacipirellula parvula]BBO31288.1 NADH dehydrogenase [Lacipirellula parvula]
MRRILVLGGGFAGLWSAAGAARKLDELGIGGTDVEVTLVNRDAYHSIRVRNYEADLAATRVPLSEVLDPIGVRLVEGDVRSIDFARQTVDVQGAGGAVVLAYDRLVFALGSELVRRPLPGFAEYAFDIDTYDGAARLESHLGRLVAEATSPTMGDRARWVVLVVGAGLTGIEAAAELPGRLRALRDASGEEGREVRVILADHGDHIGSDMGAAAQPVIAEALTALGVETRTGVRVSALSAAGATLESGELIPAGTIVWCAGMRANQLTELFPVQRDRLGRLPVNEFLQVKGMPHVFAAGDSAVAMMDEQHASVMSCQHGRPMGRFAGHNVVCDLLGLPMLPLRIDWYVTVLDLGPWGALYTEGWDRHVVAVGATAKATKRVINCERIYPPRGGDRREILEAAAPVVQRPPAYQS